MQEIPYIAYEAECARHDRTVKRLIAVLVLCVLLIVGCNIAWLIAWNQYDYTEEYYDYDQNGRGINVIGDDNEVGQYESETNYPPQD
jgi:hypothetical protein